MENITIGGKTKEVTEEQMKAIEVILEELEKNPPEKLKRPPYPVKTRK